MDKILTSPIKITLDDLAQIISFAHFWDEQYDKNPSGFIVTNRNTEAYRLIQKFWGNVKERQVTAQQENKPVDRGIGYGDGC